LQRLQANRRAKNIGVCFRQPFQSGFRSFLPRRRFANSAGADLSTKYVGNNFPIQLSAVGAPAGTRLTYLSYTQSLFDQMLGIRFGRLTMTLFEQYFTTG
jgi:hypothetical protein